MWASNDEQFMLNWNEYLQLSAGLVSGVNPIGVIPTVISLTINRSSTDKKRTAMVCASSVAMVYSFRYWLVSRYCIFSASVYLLLGWLAAISAADGHFNVIC